MGSTLPAINADSGGGAELLAGNDKAGSSGGKIVRGMTTRCSVRHSRLRLENCRCDTRKEAGTTRGNMTRAPRADKATSQTSSHMSPGGDPKAATGLDPTVPYSAVYSNSGILYSL